MVQFTLEQLYAWVGLFLWPFFRVAAFMAVAPVFGESSIPMYVKIGVAAIIAIAITPLMGDMPIVPPGSFAAMGLILEQVMIGLALGLTMKMVFAAILMAGELIGLQMGLSFASFFDPASGGNTSVMSRLLNAFAMLLFVAVNGHLMLVLGLARTFEMIPVAGAGGMLDSNGIGHLIQYSEQIFISGMLLALPLVFALLTINLCMGILNRTAQQLSVFAVGFPITLSVSMALLTIVVPRMDGFLENLFMQGIQAMSDVANGFAGPLP